MEDGNPKISDPQREIFCFFLCCVKNNIIFTPMDLKEWIDSFLHFCEEISNIQYSTFIMLYEFLYDEDAYPVKIAGAAKGSLIKNPNPKHSICYGGYASLARSMTISKGDLSIYVVSIEKLVEEVEKKVKHKNETIIKSLKTKEGNYRFAFTAVKNWVAEMKIKNENKMKIK